MKLKYILFVIILIAASSSSFGTSYTWIGTTSSWNLSSNWSPSGIPDSADNVTISSGTYSPLLDQARKITNLTLSSKTIDLNGYSLTVYGTATMTSGTVTNGTFYARGNLASFNGTVMDCPVDAICGYIRLSGSTFNETADFTDLGAATGTGSGGCTFNGDVTITHTGTLTYFTLANTTGDTFNGNVTFTNNSNREIHIASSGATLFNGNVILNSTSSGGISFANGGGSATIATGKTISIGSSGFSADFLTLKNFTQNGSTAQTLTLTGTAVVNMIAATFNGNLTITAPGILLKNSTFNGTATITRNGSSGNHQSDGGNTFNFLTLDNAGSSGRVRWATTTPDIYNGDATFNSTGGQDVQIAYSGDNIFAGNITINSNKVVFNTNTGKVTFTGINNQTLNGSYNYPFKKLAINKTAGTVTANTTLSVDDSLIFIQGNLITTSTNLLTMKNGSTATGASNSSFVSGPVKKVGNVVFEYPIGKGESYLPLTISAPSTSSSEFVAEYKIDSLGVNTGAKDTTLGYVFRDRYWTLNRTSGSSSVYVTLSWDGNYKLVDSIATTCYWDGSKWANLGQGTYSSTDSSGTMRTSNTISSFSEFTFAYKNIATIPNVPFSCLDIQNQGQLQICLLTGATLCRITTDIELEVTGPTGFLFLPLPVSSGTTLEGYSNSASSSPKWWEEDCPILSTSHTTQYNPNFKKSMFMFTLEPGAVIQNLRLRGASCNFQDYNGDQKLCGGIYVGDDWGSSAALIANCEISCFSYAGFFKSGRPRAVALENCYVHKVKANGNAPGLGYGCWAQGGFDPSQPEGDITYENVIFDDCKAAIDGQGYPNNWNINKCSFTQFFLSEDINMHNVNHEILNSPALNFSCYSAPTTCLGNIFYGPKCTTSDVCSTGVICSGYPSKPPPNGWQTDGQQIHIYDNGGANTTIENSIFHNYILKDKKGTNISLNYPLRNHPLGNTSYSISILNNTFSTPFYDPKDIFTYNNNGGYARVADNYIEACVWGTTFNRSGNSFSYKPGLTAATQPCEVYLNLIESGNTNTLPTTLNRSATPNRSFTQWIDPSTDFRLSLSPGALGSSTLSYIIRPNPNQDIATQVNMVMSNENYFYDGEIITDQSIVPIPGYDKPGLYGIDVLGFDSQTGGEFKTSAWQHIPLIVKPLDTDNNILYFNIKDSFKEFLGVSSTGVFKQVEFNGFPIWWEDIAEGGDGWEYVEIDLKQNIPNTTIPILSKINLDGTKNTITFSISMGPDPVSTSTVRGVLVWVDDIYIKKHSHPFGENLILDGSVENSSNADFKATPSEKCSWYSEAAVAMSNCDPLRITTGANGEVKNDPTLRYVDGEPVFSSGTGTFYPDAGISNTERKSGSNAIALILPAFENEAGCFDYPVDPNTSVIGASTDIDFTDMFPCSSYLSSPLNFTSLPCTTIPQVFDNGERFLITTDYTLCGNLTLKGCQIALEPDVKIIIPNGKTLTIDNEGTLNSHLFACDEMWKGIIVEPGGHLVIDGNKSNGIPGTVIEHAEVAVDANNGGSIDIENVTFDHNNTSVSIRPGVFNASAGNQIRNTEFYCSNFQMTKSPFAGKFPESHIILNDVGGDMQIGNSALSGSARVTIFENALHGITCVNSNLNVVQSSFNNIFNRDNVFDPQSMASAIKVVNSIPGLDNDIIIGHDDDDFQNQFMNVNIGIELAGQLTNSGYYRIFNNLFDNSAYTESGSLTNFHNTAIVARNGRFANTTFLNLYDNTINDFRLGIYAANISGAIIGYLSSDFTIERPNTINFNFEHGFAPSEIYRGIWLQNCHNAFVANSAISNSEEITGTTTNFRGIEMQHCFNGRLNCNIINNIPIDFYFLGHCEGTLLRANEMTHYDEGVHLESATIADQFQVNDVGLSEPTDNVWNDPDTGIDPGTSLPNPTDRVTGSIIGSSPFNWYYRTSGGIYNPLDAGMTSLIILIQSDAAGNVECNDISDRQSRLVRFGPTVADTLTFSSYEEENLWMSRKYAYECMKADTTLLYGDTLTDIAFQTFFMTQDSLNTGKFTTIRLLSVDSTTFGDASALNELVNDEIALETHLKAINSYYFTQIALGDTLDDSDSSAILEIALLPYFEGGEAAFIGIGMLGLEHTPAIPQLRLGNEIPTSTDPSQVENNSITIYPNPTNDYFYVKYEGVLFTKMEIYNSKLQLLKTIEDQITGTGIYLKYPPGVYCIKLYLETGEAKWTKLVKL